MQWENLTSTDFAAAVRATGTCIIALGVLEKHSKHPDHYAGDARPATAEKGRALRQLEVDALAEYIAAVKADQALPALQREFFQRAKDVGSA
jgi:hypothetical protein